MSKITAMLLAVLVASATCPSGVAAVQDSPSSALRQMKGQDHFAADPQGLYAGVQDDVLREELCAKVSAALEALAIGVEQGNDQALLLATFKQHLDGIDRDMLDAEDAEQVALIFERMLDVIGIERSGGALNIWLYGFDPA